MIVDRFEKAWLQKPQKGQQVPLHRIDDFENYCHLMVQSAKFKVSCEHINRIQKHINVHC
jgi:hypothetical protein